MRRDLSTRASLAIVAATAVTAAVLVILTWPSDDNPSSTAVAAAPTPTPQPTATPETGPAADLKFPKSSGDWTLDELTFKRTHVGTLGGTGRISYAGTKNAATGTFTVIVYSGGHRVGTMTAATSQARRNTTTAVTWESTDPWQEPCDGVVFTAA